MQKLTKLNRPEGQVAYLHPNGYTISRHTRDWNGGGLGGQGSGPKVWYEVKRAYRRGAQAEVFPRLRDARDWCDAQPA